MKFGCIVEISATQWKTNKFNNLKLCDNKVSAGKFRKDAVVVNMDIDGTCPVDDHQKSEIDLH